MTTKHTIVVGGGVIGVSTAYYLARRGEQVTLLEQGDICSGCSQGNAGQITPGHLPLPVPGTLMRNLRWLFKPSSPLFIAPRLDPKLWRWLVRFQLACNERHLHKSTRILCQLGAASIELFRELAESIEFRLQDDGRLEICRTDKSFGGAVREAKLLESFGYSYQKLSGREVNDFEPAIDSDVYGGIFYNESGACDPQLFVEQLAAQAVQAGATIQEQTEVEDLIVQNGRCVGVRTSSDEIRGDDVVLAQGSWAPQLVKRIGQPLPIQPGKGYHLDINAPESNPSHPVVLIEERIFVTPLNGRLRFAGTMEFSGFNLKPRQTRLVMLAKGGSKYFRGLDHSDVQSEWCHMRPMTWDGMPVLGPFQKIPNLWAATGHGMLGLTQGPITGKLLAEWICDGQPGIPVDELSPDRFN